MNDGALITSLIILVSEEALTQMFFTNKYPPAIAAVSVNTNVSNKTLLILNLSFNSGSPFTFEEKNFQNSIVQSDIQMSNSAKQVYYKRGIKKESLVIC